MRSLTIPLVAIALALGGCDPKPSGNDAAVANEAAPALPAFAITTETAIQGIHSLGDPWGQAKQSDPMRDAKTGGMVDVMTSDDGSAQVFSRPTGKVWKLRLTSGAPNRCGTSAVLIAALPKLTAMLKPGATLTEADVHALGDGMTGLRPTTRTVDGIEATVVGGCTQWLTLAVPDQPATPAAG